MAQETPTSTAPTSISRCVVRTPLASHAALAQASGYARFNQLARSLSAPTLSSSSNVQDSADQVVDPEERERRAVEEDRKVVEAEILAYEAAGILDEDHPESKDFDLLRYWQVHCFNNLFYLELTLATVEAGNVSVDVEGCLGCTACSGISCPL